MLFERDNIDPIRVVEVTIVLGNTNTLSLIFHKAYPDSKTFKNQKLENWCLSAHAREVASWVETDVAKTLHDEGLTLPSSGEADHVHVLLIVQK